MPLANVRGQRLHYEDTGGPGLPLVLSHGFLMDSDMFQPQVRALSGARRVITWDQRGHGRTGKLRAHLVGERDIDRHVVRAGSRGLVRVEGAGHASSLTHPEPVNRAIEDFLASL